MTATLARTSASLTPGEPPARATALPRRPLSPERIAGWVVIAALLGFGAFSIGRLGLTSAYLANASQKLRAFFGNTSNTISFPPLHDLVYLTGLTLGVVVLGTLVAALISVPVAYLAAANTAPTPWLRWVGRAIGVVARATPDIVIAFSVSLMFALGSTIPGVIAFGIHSIGMISKLFADAIESSDPGPRLAIRAAGGSKAQEFWAGVFPQVFPAWVASALHRFDTNLRGSAILGYAGVGGLGYAMAQAFHQFNYGRGLGIALVIFLLCVALEIVSSTVRHSLLGVAPSGRGLGERIVRAATKRAAGADAAAPASARAVLEPTARLRRPWTAERVRHTSWVVLALVFVALSAWWAQIDPSQIMWGDVWPTIKSFWPPNLGHNDRAAFFTAVLDTLQIAFAAATASFLFAVVFGSLAARNVAPNRLTRGVFRVVLTALRGIPEIVVALFLIVIVGLGVIPAFVALTIGGVGLLGRLVADQFEDLPNGPERALTAAGATRTQRYFAATLPHGLPALLGSALYLVDNNVRSAVLLGAVGAGGIGYYLVTAAPQLDLHGEVTTLIAILIVVVLALEGLAAWLRRVFA